MKANAALAAVTDRDGLDISPYKPITNSEHLLTVIEHLFEQTAVVPTLPVGGTFEVTLTVTLTRNEL